MWQIIIASILPAIGLICMIGAIRDNAPVIGVSA